MHCWGVSVVIAGGEVREDGLFLCFWWLAGTSLGVRKEALCKLVLGVSLSGWKVVVASALVLCSRQCTGPRSQGVP